MFSLKRRKGIRPSVTHFALIRTVNIFLLCALIIMSCAPSPRASSSTREGIESAAVLPLQAESDGEAAIPVLTHPEPRIAGRPDYSAQNLSLPVYLEKSKWEQLMFSEQRARFAAEMLAQAQLDAAAKLASIKEQFKSPEPAPNPVRTIIPRSESENESGNSSENQIVPSLNSGENVGSATIFIVNTLDDTDDGICDSHCSLREAIYAANDAPGEDTIIFQASGSIRLQRPLPYITGSDGIIIDNAGQDVKLSGGNSTGAFHFASFLLPALQAPDPNCDIYSETSLTLTGTYDGYAICVLGALTINESILINSDAWTESTLTISDSTITHSSVYTATTGDVFITNSTLTSSFVWTDGNGAMDIIEF